MIEKITKENLVKLYVSTLLLIWLLTCVFYITSVVLYLIDPEVGNRVAELLLPALMGMTAYLIITTIILFVPYKVWWKITKFIKSHMRKEK